MVPVPPSRSGIGLVFYTLWSFAPKQIMILFLCTGNFYRSRFAEIYFNFKAVKAGLDARAFSRGLQAAAGRNKGPISMYTTDFLAHLQVPAPPVWGYPEQLLESDFDRARTVIALDETEHRPMVLRDFPHRLPEVEFWQFPDIQFESPAHILPAIREQVDRLIENI